MGFLANYGSSFTASLFVCLNCGGPRGIAAAVATKNSPPDCFLNVATASQRDNRIFLANYGSLFTASLFVFRVRSVAKTYFYDIMYLYISIMELRK